jgi:hypothetical protein
LEGIFLGTFDVGLFNGTNMEMSGEQRRNEMVVLGLIDGTVENILEQNNFDRVRGFEPLTLRTPCGLIQFADVHLWP